MERSGDLVAAGAAVREAAESQDAELLIERGELSCNACQGCHWDYRFEEDPETIRTH